MRYSALGEIAASCWLALPDHFSTIELDLWVVMPNHVHGIVVLHEDGSARLTEVIGNYKAAVTRAWQRSTGGMGQGRGGIYPAPTNDPARIWQRNFHDHIIRNERALNQIRQYILANPTRWSTDSYYRA